MLPKAPGRIRTMMKNRFFNVNPHYTHLVAFYDDEVLDFILRPHKATVSPDFQPLAFSINEALQVP